MGNNSSSPPPVQPVPPAPVNTLAPSAPPPPADTPPTPQNSQPMPQTPTPGAPPTMASVVPSTNPGTYEDLHKKLREIFPQAFEGAKMVVGRSLSSHFQVNHTLTLSTPPASSYRFGATYVGSKQFSPQEVFPVFVGDIDASGNLNANVIHAFSKKLYSRFVAQFQGPKANFQANMDYKADTYSASLLVANPDVLAGSGMFVSQFLQRVTPMVDIGAECIYQKGAQVPGGQAAFMSLAARLNGEKWQLSGTLSPAGPTGPGMHLSYYQKVDDTIQVGTELETSLGMGQSIATVGYQVDVPSTGATFKAQFDTMWNVQSTLEKKMDSQFPLTFVISAEGNPVKSDFKVGVGLMLG